MDMDIIKKYNYKLQSLGEMKTGSLSRIVTVSGADVDVERCLTEMGFVQGASVEILHHGWLQRDPLAVCVNDGITIALRRCEAKAVLVYPIENK